MNAPSYDTLEGIEAAAARGLEGFTELRRERHVAGYTRRERLSEWLVARRYWLDSCGNVFVLETPARDRKFVTSHVSGTGTASLSPVATHDMTCVRCGRGWTLSEAHDYRPVRDANDVIQHYHAGCHRYMMADHARAELTGVVRKAGMAHELLDVPNLYGSEQYAGPWLTMITDKLGRVTLGWRKRVIAIEWERGPDGDVVFADEPVTKARGLVHAWTPDDATNYLRRLMEAAC
jgi:hypothetical protein